jgi:putative Mg2+ transporter-C (MgtC) family protein
MVAYINDFVLNMVNQYPTFTHYIFIVIKIIMACVFGGLIGYEREKMNRPAGLRTHILVCLGATLVMISSEIIFQKYKGLTNLDPARLGAQVISGIGFLGAGTILKDGLTVKGLTTAATLWATGCIGLAIGIGFYSGAFLTTFFILMILIVFKKLEDGYTKKKRLEIIQITFKDAENHKLLNSTIKDIFMKNGFGIKEISYINNKDSKISMQATVKLPFSYERQLIPSLFNNFNGIENVLIFNENADESMADFEKENIDNADEYYEHCDLDNDE